MKNRKIAVLVLIIVAVFGLIIFILSNFTYSSRVTVAGRTYEVEVAETKYFLEKGLSGHAPLKSNQGMFFVFEKADNYGFWMKDMTFTIDIIWIGPNFRVTHVEKSVSPNTYPKIFYPEAPSMYVLEIAGGQSEQINLKNGDLVKFERKAEKNL